MILISSPSAALKSKREFQLGIISKNDLSNDPTCETATAALKSKREDKALISTKLLQFELGIISKNSEHLTY